MKAAPRLAAVSCLLLAVARLGPAALGGSPEPESADGRLVERIEKEVEDLADVNPRQALASLEQALKLNKRSALSGDTSKLDDLSENYLWRGYLHDKLGHTDQAIKDFREALAWSLRSGNREYQAEALNHLGALSRIAGEFDQARASYEQALSVLGDLPKPELRIRMLRNLAEVFRIQNNDVQADDLLKSALSLAERTADLVSRNQVLMDLGWARQLADDHRGALGFYWQIFEDYSRLPIEEQVHFFDRLATTLADLQRPGDAWLAYQEGLKLARQSRNWHYEARLSVHRCGLAVRFPQLERKDGGSTYCSEAETLIRELSDTNLKAVFLDYKSKHLQQIDQLTSAIDAAREATKLIDSLRFTVPGRNGRSRFLEDRSHYFRHMADLLMEAHRRDPEAGFDLQALQVSERLKARSMLDLWSVAGIDLLSKVPASQRHELEAKRNQLDELELTRRSPETEARIGVLLADLDALAGRLLRSSAQQGWLPPPIISLEGVQTKLDSKSAIVVLLFGDKKSYLFVIRDRGPVRSFELAPPQDLAAAADDFLRNLADPDSAVLQAALDESGRHLAALLWGEQEERLATLPERLIFVGDGRWQQLPLYPLPRLNSPAKLGRQLIDSHEVVYLPSLSLVGEWATRKARLGRPTRNAKVFGDPLYQLADHHSPGVVELGKDELKRLFPQGPEGLRLGRLPFAEREAEGIRARFGQKYPIDVALRAQASKAEAMSPELGNYSIVHFASHGRLDPLHDELSSLLLSEVDSNGRPTDGRLRLQDLYEIATLRADLVVASACQTGVGDNLRLEGAGGIAQGFLQAGAQRVVLSLWPVESEATAYLMDRFYLHLLRGMPAGAALREASRDLRQLAKDEHKQWDSPFHWSPFILVGDWSSFELPDQDQD